MKTKKFSAEFQRNGSTLIIAMVTLATLSLVAAALLESVTTRYNATQKAIGWAEALNAADAGADYGLANCRMTLTSGAWTGWKKYDSSTSSWIAVTNTADANAQLAAGNKIIYDLPSNSHLGESGEGTVDLWYHVEVDAPGSFVVGGNQWYRVRATGYAGLPGLSRASNDGPSGQSKANILRKFDLRKDHFIKAFGDYANPAGTDVAVTPQATRRIELIVKPQTPFAYAIFTAASSGTPLSIPIVDSFDSSNAATYPGGLYTSGPRNPSTGVGTNGTVYVNAPISTLDGQIYGNVETRNGTVSATSNIYGTVNNNANQTATPVTVPSWAVTASTACPAALVAGTTAAPIYRSYTSLTDLVVTLPVGQTTGVANIYITGDVGGNGNAGSITVAAGVTLKLYFSGDFQMKNRNINNANNNAANLQFYGVDPATGSRTFDINSGNPGNVYFSLNAPGYDMTVGGNPDFCGSWIAKTVNGNGNTSWHYDEALRGVGDVTDYTRATWVEDER